MKIAIPVTNEKGDILEEHFGRAPYFSLYTIENGKILEKTVKINDSDHFGGIGQPPERIEAMGAKIVISSGMGMKAIQMFQNKKIAILEAVSKNADSNVDEYLKSGLKELTQGCLHDND
ncbi:NifB/NifX family molybdenum-iron cluster-binding protein [Candidatus Bathyarchaeota archaeon]|nr:NifB/NifX family molybdenum-iron cluster-binding protein [Candidatus Bathyarchaeota archaeon]